MDGSLSKALLADLDHVVKAPLHTWSPLKARQRISVWVSRSRVCEAEETLVVSERADAHLRPGPHAAEVCEAEELLVVSVRADAHL